MNMFRENKLGQHLFVILTQPREQSQPCQRGSFEATFASKGRSIPTQTYALHQTNPNESNSEKIGKSGEIPNSTTH